MSDQWYYTSEGKQMDPVTTGELKRLASRGLLKPTDLVWREGWPKWERAGNHQELFVAEAAADEGAAYKVRGGEISEKPAAARVTRREEEDEERPARRERRREEEAEGEEEFEERPRRRRRKKSNAPLIWGLVGGLVGIAVLVVVIILIVNAVSGGSGPIRSWSLGQDGKKTYSLNFTQGKKVEIWVKSNTNSDMDLFVFPPGTRAQFREAPGGHMPVGQSAFDIGDSKDCYIHFIAPQTGTYEVVVWNRRRSDAQFRNMSNSGTMEFKESEPGPLAANPPPGMPQIPPFDPKNPVVIPKNFGKIVMPDRKRPPMTMKLSLRPGTTTMPGMLSRIDGPDPKRPNSFCKIHTCNMMMDKTYTIDLESQQFDSFLRIEDATGQQLASDDDGGEGLNSRIVFQPPANGVYKIIVTTLGPGATGQYTLKVQQD